MNKLNYIRMMDTESRKVNRKNALTETEKLQYQLAAIVQSSTDAIIGLDLSGYIENWNKGAEKIYGYEFSEVLGKHAAIVVPEECIIEFRDFIVSITEGGVISPFETTHITREGNYIDVQMSMSPIYDDYENLIGISLIAREISDFKNAQRELIKEKENAEQASRLKSSLLANVNHELRTPMNGILGFSTILYDEIEDPEKRDMVRKIQISANRLMNTLNSIIELSEIESANKDISINELNLNTEIEKLLKSYKDDAQARNIQLRLNEKEKNLKVYAERGLLINAVRHLLDNAFKFTEEGSITLEIDRAASEDNNWAILKISDTGRGIDKKKIDTIFEAFRQESEGYGRPFEGTGLGLTITKKIIDALNGYIAIESEPGNGSVFKIHLPEAGRGDLSKSNGNVKESSGSGGLAIPAGGTGEKPAVLLVEDNLINRDVVKMFLGKTHNIDHAVDGASAVKLAKAKKYNLILMDINLGAGMNGLEAVKHIRSIEGYDEVPIIAVTGYGMSGDKKKIIEAGCDSYILKPFTFTELTNAINSAYSLGK